MANYIQHTQVRKATLAQRHWGAGAIAGLIAGIVMAMIAMVRAAAMGAGATTPVKEIAALVLGVQALIGGMGTLMIGLVIHLVFSVVLGAIFAGLIGAMAPAKAFGFGIAYGITVWAAMTFGLLPWTNPTMAARVAMTPGSWFVLHLIFGGCCS